jgi:hypothetical protein
VSGQRHAPAALYPWGNDPGVLWTGAWVGPRDGLDTEAREKMLRVIIFLKIRCVYFLRMMESIPCT